MRATSTRRRTIASSMPAPTAIAPVRRAARWLAGLALTTFPLAAWARPRLPARFLDWMSYLSRRVTSLYVISWIVIVWSLSPIGYMTQDSGWALLGLVAGVFALSVAIDRGATLLMTRHHVIWSVVRPARAN